MYNSEDDEENKTQPRTYEYYKNKIDLNNIDISKIEHKKLLVNDGFGMGTYYGMIIKSILSSHGYNPEAWLSVDSIFDEEFPNVKEQISSIWWKYDDIKTRNETLSKYKDVNEDYLKPEEKATIQRIKDELEFNKHIEEHNVLIDKIQRIEANIDKLGPRAEEQYYSKHKAQKSASIMSVLATLLSIVYAVIATFLIIKYSNVGEFLSHNCFGQYSGFLEKGIGVVVIIIFIAFLGSAYLGCINLMSKWSESIGMFALIAGAIGVVYGPLMLFQALSRSQMEIELGYSDPSKSYGQVSSEYEKLKAARAFNRRR